MRTYLLTFARFAASTVLVVVLLALALALWLGDGRLSPEWVRLLAIGTATGFALHLLSLAMGKRHPPCAHRAETRRASYVFGYWVAVVGVLSAIAASHFGLVRADTALPLVGLVLIGPTVFTAWVQFRP